MSAVWLRRQSAEAGRESVGQPSWVCWVSAPLSVSTPTLALDLDALIPDQQQLSPGQDTGMRDGPGGGGACSVERVQSRALSVSGQGYLRGHFERLGATS